MLSVTTGVVPNTRGGRHATTLAALAVAVTLTAGCGTQTGSAPTSTAPVTGTSTTSAPTTSAPATGPAQSGVSNGQTYAVTTASIAGSTPDQRGRWNAEIAQLSGGDPNVATAFNKAGDASARDQIEQMRSEASSDGDWLFESDPTVTFRPVAIAQVIAGAYSAAHAAHPTNFVSTVVIDSRTAKPITLSRLFTNEQDGLKRLSEQTKKIFPQVYGGGPSPMPDEQGNRPIAENFANWIPAPGGIELHFADYQFGHGLPVITVPWSAVTDLLAPDMAALTHD